jgi:hypothetical protein
MLHKKIITVFTCIFISCLAFAQFDDTRDQFKLGLKAGVNISNVWDAEGEEFVADAKVGATGGIFAVIPLGSLFGIQPEVLVSQKGFKGSGALFGVPYSFSRTTTFIDVPLLIQIKPAKFLTVVVGPQFSYLLKQKDVYTVADDNTEIVEEFDNDNIRKNILGIVAGADFIYRKFVFSSRVGLDFQTNNGDGTSNTPRYKNQWLQFAVGYTIL